MPASLPAQQVVVLKAEFRRDAWQCLEMQTRFERCCKGENWWITHQVGLGIDGGSGQACLVTFASVHPAEWCPVGLVLHILFSVRPGYIVSPRRAWYYLKLLWEQKMLSALCRCPWYFLIGCILAFSTKIMLPAIAHINSNQANLDVFPWGIYRSYEWIRRWSSCV